jgi:acyl carrier protein
LFFDYETAEVIGERILEILAIELGLSKHELEVNPPRLDDLGLDSLDMIELVMLAEQGLQ